MREGPVAAALMFQGTGSDVGKSLIVAGLCRAFSNRGLNVRPFKPQNMSNNAAVTADGGSSRAEARGDLASAEARGDRASAKARGGEASAGGDQAPAEVMGEIGRAQALQARACRVAPSVHMNPVLLKPQSEMGAQLVVLGRMRGNANARAFQAMKRDLLPTVLASFAHLRAEADLVLVEGAGSAAEVNLRANDIANMGFARAANIPVVLIGDIDRGGVIAQLVGTKAVIDPEDAALIAGFLVNKFRGDPSLFQPGMDLITAHTGWPALGLIPFFAGARSLPAEDAMALDHPPPATPPGGKCTIVVPRLPYIANFDDLDPLRQEPALRLVIVPPGEPLPQADLIILPGSKSTIADLDDLRCNGWDIDILAHVRRGGRVLGICGGFQMLGHLVADPGGIEGPPGSRTGLGLLDVETVLSGEKSLTEVSGISLHDGAPFRGYEMHTGLTNGPGRARPLLRFSDGRTDGAVSADGRVRASYVHGLFSDDRQRGAWMAWLGQTASGISHEAEIDRVLDGLAAHLERHTDLDRLLKIARG